MKTTKKAAKSGRLSQYLTLLLLGIVGSLSYIGASPAHAATTHKLHFIQNTSSSTDFTQVHALGYTLIDVGMDAATIRSLPAGTQAMVWVGNSQCSSFDVNYTDFKAFINAMGKDTTTNARIYGYNISDEPDAGSCPQVVAAIKRRADYIHSHAGGQGKIAYISITDFPYKPLVPAKTDVDIYGIDPYPCHQNKNGCNLNEINNMVNAAVNAGIPESKLVPIYQAFGEECTNPRRYQWSLPSPSEMRTVFARWDQVLPNAPIDVTYAWRHPGDNNEDSCPTLKDAQAKSLRAVYKDYLSKH
ncbi:hypothetical protein KSF_110000 [Reticulibacter mediterranei]|uniref:Uncharacterized protein n=1 Tax=Reticulibacter mediterranei TaxID=2778369 RepID=A0A8J3NB00_9CHLR|nr:hypothetical protein [Reticulibacter mediterranei]GHP00953.1 hypothetical protein KSF_110000 [Reticulibacter mediterranei]